MGKTIDLSDLVTTHFDIRVETLLQSLRSMTRYMMTIVLTGTTKLEMKKPMWNIPKLYL